MTRMLPITIAFLALPSLARAVPAQLAHQGRLLGDDSVPIEDTHSMLFSLHDDLEDGEVVWEELHDVVFTNGYYNVILGADEDDNPLDAELLGLYPLFLELTVDGGSPLEPRHELVSVPYAVMADTCENVMGGIVDVSEVRIDGEVVITEGGAWTGDTSPVAWDDLTDMPEGFADGIDDDTVLTESEVEGYITDEAIGLASGSTMGGEDISTGEHTVDTTLSESEVEGYVTDEAINLAVGSTVGGASITTGEHTSSGPIIAMTSLTGANATIRSASFTTIDTFTIEKISGSSDMNFQISVGESVSSYTHDANTQIRLYNETTGTEVRRVQGVWLYGPWMSTSTRDEISANVAFNAQEYDLPAGSYTYAVQGYITTPEDNILSTHGLSFTLFEVEG